MLLLSHRVKFFCRPFRGKVRDKKMKKITPHSENLKTKNKPVGVGSLHKNKLIKKIVRLCAYVSRYGLVSRGINPVGRE